MAERINADNFDKKVEEMINDYKTTKEKSYDPTEDIKDIVAMILDKFSNNKNYMNGIKTLIDKVQIDEENDTIFFEVEDGFDESDCEDCDDKENCDVYKEMNDGADKNIIPTPITEDRDWVRIFDNVNVDDLNRAIDQFEKEFDDRPYLIMSEDTLKIFEQCVDYNNTISSCLNIETNDIDCEDYDGCNGCPYEPDTEGNVVVECDCQSGGVTAFYTHNDVEYTIVIDNNLAFGVVKVR